MFIRNKSILFLIIISFLLIPFKFSQADIADDLSGYILLQVEAHGEAWYVYPGDNWRYYLGLPEDAFGVMRDKGLGISHAELQKYLKTFFPVRLSGMILLDVEAKGEAYYVFPGDLQGYYLGRPADAFKIMREKGLGITNKNLSYIDSESPWAVWEEEVIGDGRIVDTGQKACYSDSAEMNCQDKGGLYFGQDAQYQGKIASYKDNDDDGTVTDNNTGLMWRKDFEEKTDYASAKAEIEASEFSDFDDWRLPSIKELYSLIDFSGIDLSNESNEENSTPFINTKFLDFKYGDEIAGERLIDSQWMTSDVYTSTVMNNEECFFGVNFADGRIKCYQTSPKINSMNDGYFYRMVRGPVYGGNAFADNKNGTIYDKNTELTWTQADSKEGMDWYNALNYCEDLLLAGHDDWRLPNAKELQNIVDYNRSPEKTNSPAINPVFTVSEIKNEAGQKDYPYYWTSTTHVRYPNIGDSAVYVAFGRAMGYMNEFGGWVDVHGAGAQRSDPKTGLAEDYPQGRGPQGDAIRINNYVRCVRGAAKLVKVKPTVADYEVVREEKKVEVVEIPVEVVVETPAPPAEAIIACYGSILNQECGFNAPLGRVNGICVKLEDELFCRP